MDIITAGDLVTSVARVIGFAEQLSKVFNNHALTNICTTESVRDHMNVLSATITPLKQVRCLLEDETRGNGKRLFSDAGLSYVSLLVKECATKLAKIAPIVAHAGLRRDRKWTRKNNKLKTDIVVLPAELTLDETILLNDLQNAHWNRVFEHTHTYLNRLGQVQVRLLLVQQVITLGALSKNDSSKKMDIEKIVGQHELITRTARVAGISQSGHSRLIYRRSSLSNSTISSSDDSSSSDGDEIFDSSIRRPARPISLPPPPPPLAPPPFSIPSAPLTSGSSALPGPPQSSGPLPPLPPPSFRPSLPSHPPSSLQCTTIPMVKPPSYESHTRMNLASRKPSTFYATLGGGKKQDAKEQSENSTSKLAAKGGQTKSSEGRLFNSQHNSFGFKIKSLFRSKDSLAKEMKAVLENTQCVLQAFLIEQQDIHPIPHSTFHSLEATHMRDILSQLNGDSWFETYSKLTAYEHDTLDAAIYDGLDPNKNTKREVVVLKLLQENKANAWLRLLTKCLGSESPFPHHLNGRVVLVILREHLVDGERKMLVPRGYIPDPADSSTLPPQMNTNIKPTGPMMNRPPPVNLPPVIPSAHRGPPPGAAIHPNRPGGLGLPMHLPPPPPMHPPPPLPSLRSDPGPQAMETYHEFTIRVADRGPNEPRTWDHVVITKESNSQAVVLNCVDSLAKRGITVIGVQLSLTEQQAKHVSNMMDDLKLCETDNKFEWCWVLLGLHDDKGRECFFFCEPSESTKIHLVAMRCLKKEYRPGGTHYSPLNLPPPPHLRPSPNSYPGCTGPPPPPLPPPPPMIIHSPNHLIDMPSPVPSLARNTRRKRSAGTDITGSDTDYSSDTSYRSSRRRRHINQKRFYSDSDSDDEDDPLKIDLKLRRGDDIVKKLLELWTPQSEDNK
ncbi:origin recognition complex subunit 4 [Clarireedia jacksonii]